MYVKGSVQDLDTSVAFRHLCQRQLFSVLQNIEDEFYLITKSERRLPKGASRPPSGSSSTKLQTTSLVLTAQISVRMKLLRSQPAKQILQTKPATATLLLILNYLASENVSLNYKHTVCSGSDASSEKLRERLKVYSLPKSSHSVRSKHHNYKTRG